MEQSQINPNPNPDPSSSSSSPSPFSIPRGGRIFVPDHVSPPIRVCDYEAEVFHTLQNLMAELDSEISEELDQEVSSMDVLKVYTEEELVSQAVKIAFEDDEVGGTASPDIAGNPCSSGVEDDPRALDPDTSALCESHCSYSSDPSSNGEENDSNLKRRKGRTQVKTNLKNKRRRKLISREKDKQTDETYLAKVEHLVKLRQKQEEDTKTAKLILHSFTDKKDDSALLSSANIKTLKCLELFRPLKGKYFTAKHVPIRYPEVILCVEVYQHKGTWKLTQELMVLGSQVLTELRDKIRCFTDVVMQKAEDYDPSGYFLIEEVFCNDKRDPSAIDYSEPIFEWLRNFKDEVLAKWNYILSDAGKKWKVLKDDMPKAQSPIFRSVDMDKTRFCDLPFRLGNGYLYCHQGDCKHKIIIRDMRLVHPEDLQNRAAYPLIVYQAKAILQKCTVCAIYKATKVTFNDKFAGENPCFFCKVCFDLLHCRADKKALQYDDFDAHEYLQDYY